MLQKRVQSILTSARAFGSLAMAGEPTGPKMITSFPGPKNQQAIKDYGSVTCNLTQQFGFFVDVKKSKGNFVSDIDGNVYLDMF